MSSRSRPDGLGATTPSWSERVKEPLKLVMPIDRFLDLLHGRIGIGTVIASRLDGVPQNVVAQFLVILGARVVVAMSPDRIDAFWRLLREIAHVGFDIAVEVGREEKSRVIIKDHPADDMDCPKLADFAATRCRQPAERLTQSRRMPGRDLGDGGEGTDLSHGKDSWHEVTLLCRDKSVLPSPVLKSLCVAGGF